MDDDLRTLATLLAAPEPSDAAIGRGRRRLEAAIRTPARRRRVAARSLGNRRPAAWLAGGLGLAAAATAAAVVLASGGTPVVRGSHPPVTARSGAAAQQAGQRILLTAATSAAAQPSGAYWHFKIRTTMAGSSSVEEEWVAQDGRYWSAQPACDGIPAGVVAEGTGYGGFVYHSGDFLTYQLTQDLPTSPAALTAWFARYTPPATVQEVWLIESFTALEWLVPAPPQVRAAAFRALAELPGVTSLGPVPGGQELLIKPPQDPRQWQEFVIDPATGLVLSNNNGKAIITIEADSWTNQLPRVVPMANPGCPG